MSNAAFYFHAELLDLIGGAYVLGHASLFTGAVTSDALGLQLTYACGAPAFGLTPPPAGAGNVHASVAVPVTMYDWSNGQRGAQLASGTAQLVAGATLGLQGGALVLTGLSATASGTDFLSQNAAGVFADQVVPALSAALAKLPQPQLSGIMGLPVTLDALALRGGVAWIDATVGNGAGNGPGIDPGSPPPGASPAAVVCAVTSGVLEALARAALPKTKRDKSKHEVLGNGYDVGVFVTATSIDVAIDAGTASGRVSCTAGVTGDTYVMTRKISLPDIAIDIGKTDVTIQLSASPSQVTAGVALSSVLSLVPSGVPEVIEDVVGNLLGSVATELTTALNDSLASLMTVFTLPPSISAFGIEAGISFGWLGLMNNAMTAVIAVSPTTT